MKTECDRLPAGLFAKDPETIVQVLNSKEAFPLGAASGMRVLSFYITQASKGMSLAKRRRLEKAKAMLSAQLEREMIERERAQRRAA